MVEEKRSSNEKSALIQRVVEILERNDESFIRSILSWAVAKERQIPSK